MRQRSPDKVSPNRDSGILRSQPTDRSSVATRQPRPPASEVFGSFLRTLEKLDREAALRARQPGGAK
jgi:hypothetical protein